MKTPDHHAAVLKALHKYEAAKASYMFHNYDGLLGLAWRAVISL